MKMITCLQYSFLDISIDMYVHQKYNEHDFKKGQGQDD